MTESDTSNGFGQFGFADAAMLRASQQTATAVTRSRSDVLGPFPGSVYLSGYSITSAWNDFMLGFPDPTA